MNNKEYRLRKYEENKEILIAQLQEARCGYCGIGIKKVKLILNNLSKENKLAKIARLVLEIEDCSITAKTLYGNYAEYKYNNKQELILKLIKLCEVYNINYGFKKSDIPTIKSIILFDLPFGQVSWHTTLDNSLYKKYQGKWDKKECSTLNKLENFIYDNFKSALIV